MIPGLGTRMGSTLLTARYCDVKRRGGSRGGGGGGGGGGGLWGL